MQCLLLQVLGSLVQQAITVVRVIGMSPWRQSIGLPQLLVEMVQTMTRLLRDADALLEQIPHVLDMLGLLLQESGLKGVFQCVVTVLVSCFAEAEDIFQMALLNLQCLVHRLDGVDRVIRPFDLGGRDVRRRGAPSTLDQVVFKPHAVRKALDGGALPETASGSASELIQGRCSQGNRRCETVQRHIGTSAVGTQLAEEEPTLLLKVDMSTDGLIIPRRHRC